MARNDLQPILVSLGLPATMGPWGKDEVVPDNFVEYHYDGDSDKMADNINYRKIDRWAMSVYGKNTDMNTYYANCERLENALSDAGIGYNRSMDLFPGDEMVFSEFTFSIPR